MSTFLIDAHQSHIAIAKTKFSSKFKIVEFNFEPLLMLYDAQYVDHCISAILDEMLL